MFKIEDGCEFTDILARAHKIQKRLKSKPKFRGDDTVLVSEVLEKKLY